MLWKGAFGSFGGINALPEGPSLESTPSLLGSLLMGEGSGGGGGQPGHVVQLGHRHPTIKPSTQASWVRVRVQ